MASTAFNNCCCQAVTSDDHLNVQNPSQVVTQLFGALQSTPADFEKNVASTARVSLSYIPATSQHTPQFILAPSSHQCKQMNHSSACCAKSSISTNTKLTKMQSSTNSSTCVFCADSIFQYHFATVLHAADSVTCSGALNVDLSPTLYAMTKIPVFLTPIALPPYTPSNSLTTQNEGSSCACKSPLLRRSNVTQSSSFTCTCITSGTNGLPYLSSLVFDVSFHIPFELAQRIGISSDDVQFLSPTHIRQYASELAQYLSLKLVSAAARPSPSIPQVVLDQALACTDEIVFASGCSCGPKASCCGGETGSTQALASCCCGPSCGGGDASSSYP